ncbi:MAG: RNase J family beta-CASP ribonuclease [Zetaproteobacteria bacterium CG06_land_8_20_14_3_00_59_53]|nr:MAG: RNase J family beta-CASP ribonuclease [Zetaproteobacteria bacterium CG2_30_59_37]PIO89837.1 MAG: RNase J family beta-CASP ribonuclease [Zetaproteobacteria bacterium CG23_combo_of_CG06-09_8_20_14_all_59_86]PIQ64200.1 MAG: RNase J family beta-CASP ribonuclease [Zetaproteobacteria bacterium CG11_big_fil_rev_8_21_14_0_20_59_439]PIU70454.1 MAG: RNase J family beta-CASP ribonuclease [Zetaproteobacteria bacterium CG06_land_8_20_14_3_00_59_53]PIU97423.1 MAG: RNase J family beta-CASP ribonucleas
MTDQHTPAIGLRTFPFGGVGEFGKNMMLYAWGDEGVIVDCGMGFPEPGQYGVDVVIPDIAALDTLGIKVHAVLLTHGHEDHIGGLPYLLPLLNVPVYGTEMTLGLLAGRLSEIKGFKADLRPLSETDSCQVGPFTVEAIPVTHSIMDAVSIALHTPLGVVIHTGDFKFDPAPIDGRHSSLHRFAALGDKGVLLLASDSTNATRGGSGPTERSVGPALKQAVAGCSGLVIVTTFSSNMFRIQQIIDAAVASGRTVALAGRSLERNIGIARNMNRLKIETGQLIDIKQAGQIPHGNLLIIATGSQGEPRAALGRIAYGQFPGINLGKGDLVIFSSSQIPGNERVIHGLFSHIYRRGARVLHAGQAPLHVSGHAQAHELKTMIQLTRPRYLYPVHGEYRNLIEHGHLGVSTGIAEDHVLIAENGQSLVIDDKGARLGDTFNAGAVFVDGSERDKIDGVVLRDRRILAEDGIVTAFVLIDRNKGVVARMPEIAARGVLHQEIGDEVLENVAREMEAHLQGLGREILADEEAAGEEVRLFLRRWFKRNHGRRPMLLPVVLEA